tara:strand:- start:290 stop:1309 length:1020 start_codon:yes stop_codon:yes gene_type:complete
MNDEINTGNSEPETNSVDNITSSDFIDRRSQQYAGQEVVQEEAVSNEETESTSEKTEELNTTDVLSNMDLDSMSEDELKDISQKLGTKAVARFGELTARRKQAEERLSAMEKELQGLKKENKKSAPVVKNNPLAKIVNVNELKKHNDSAREVIEWAEGVLDEHDDYKSHDVVTEVDGKEYTKADVKKTLRQSRDVVEKYVPAQYANLQKQNSIVQTTRAFQRKVLTEFDWAKDTKSKTTQAYKAMLNDKRLNNLRDTNPELSAQMPYILAHAANSMYGRKPVGNNKTEITPPRSVGSTAARPERKTSTSSVKQKEVSQRFKDTGNINDFIALRTLQKSQ